MSDIKAIEDLIKGYSNSKEPSFLVPNLTEDYLAIRPSGKAVSKKKLVDIFNNKYFVAKFSELLKIRNIKIFSETDYGVFTLNAIFSLKCIKIKTFPHFHAS